MSLSAGKIMWQVTEKKLVMKEEKIYLTYKKVIVARGRMNEV
jgi:hypothetical protein